MVLTQNQKDVQVYRVSNKPWFKDIFEEIKLEKEQAKLRYKTVPLQLKLNKGNCSNNLQSTNNDNNEKYHSQSERDKDVVWRLAYLSNFKKAKRQMKHWKTSKTMQIRYGLK